MINQLISYPKCSYIVIEYGFKALYPEKFLLCIPGLENSPKKRAKSPNTYFFCRLGNYYGPNFESEHHRMATSYIYNFLRNNTRAIKYRSRKCC